MAPPKGLLGAVPSPDDPKDESFRFDQSPLRAGAIITGTSSPSVVDLHEWRTQLFQDCVGHTNVAQAQLFFAANGKRKPLLSPLFNYGGARVLDHAPTPGKMLPDVGCNYRNAQKVGRDWGYCAESLMPEVDVGAPETIGLAPDMFARQAARSAKMVSAHRIIAKDLASFRSQLIDATRLAVAGESTVVGFVMPATQAYVSLGFGTYQREEGPSLGYHAQPIGEIDIPNDRARVLGSWGPEFGDHGIFNIAIPLLWEIGSEFWVQVFDPDNFEVPE